MPDAVVNLTEENSRKLAELSQRTGRTPDELLNEAVERLPADPDVRPACPNWKAAMRQAAGMWTDRDDIPERMAQLKKELSRPWPSDDPT